jgi:hypothetical protein
MSDSTRPTPTRPASPTPAPKPRPAVPPPPKPPARRISSSAAVGADAIATPGGPGPFSLPLRKAVPEFQVGVAYVEGRHRLVGRVEAATTRPGNSRPQPQRPIGTPPYGPRKA